LPPRQRVLAERWILRLRGYDFTVSPVTKRRRNNYARLLLYQIETDSRLSYPFTDEPMDSVDLPPLSPTTLMSVAALSSPLRLPVPTFCPVSPTSRTRIDPGSSAYTRPRGPRSSGRRRERDLSPPSCGSDGDDASPTSFTPKERDRVRERQREREGERDRVRDRVRERQRVSHTQGNDYDRGVEGERGGEGVASIHPQPLMDIVVSPTHYRETGIGRERASPRHYRSREGEREREYAVSPPHPSYAGVALAARERELQRKLDKARRSTASLRDTIDTQARRIDLLSDESARRSLHSLSPTVIQAPDRTRGSRILQEREVERERARVRERDAPLTLEGLSPASASRAQYTADAHRDAHRARERHTARERVGGSPRMGWDGVSRERESAVSVRRRGGERDRDSDDVIIDEGFLDQMSRYHQETLRRSQIGT
ncbi:hypothetical protein KIPB_004906, partial [Kipferlia bialata]